MIHFNGEHAVMQVVESLRFTQASKTKPAKLSVSVKVHLGLNMGVNRNLSKIKLGSSFSSGRSILVSPCYYYASYDVDSLRSPYSFHFLKLQYQKHNYLRYLKKVQLMEWADQQAEKTRGQGFSQLGLFPPLAFICIKQLFVDDLLLDFGGNSRIWLERPLSYGCTRASGLDCRLPDTSVFPDFASVHPTVFVQLMPWYNA